MATNYSQLVNKAGTIYNTSTNKGYATPQELAGDLGVESGAIQWGNIAKNDAYSPAAQVQTPAPSQQTAQIPPAQQALQSAQASGPAPQNKADASGALAAVTASPTFYKATSPVAGYDPATVFDAQGKPLSYDQYLSAGGKADFSNVVSGTPPQMATQTQEVDNLLKSSAVDQQLINDPGYQQLLADRAEFNDVVNQQQSLTETYQQISTQLGIPAINTELMNMKNVIEGSEDDIRTEVTKAGGFATESQVTALTNARNKQLIKNYNNLLDTKQMAMETLSNMTNLASQDRQFAMSTLNQKLQIDQQIIEYRQRMQDNARKTYENIVSQVGYAGLQQMTGGDPYYTSLVEKTLGLGSGGLAQLSAYKKPLTEMEQAELELKKAEVAQIPLDTKLKQAQIANIYSSIAERGKPEPIQTQVVDMGNGRKVVINSQTGEIINEVGANPVDQAVKALITSSTSWGDAADKINKAFGNENAATQYDTQLKAYFDQKKDINTAFTLASPEAQKQLAMSEAQVDQISSLITAKGLNNAVGPNALVRAKSFLGVPLTWDRMTGAESNFLGDVEQLTTNLTTQKLIDLKAQGATFGALNEQEFSTIRDSATKINYWAIKKDGKVVGYKANENDFRKELDKINYFAKLDYIRKGGNPENVDVQTMPDGTLWTKNSDGTMSQF